MSERGHIITIKTDEDFDPEYPEFDYDIECLAPEKCGGWQECLEPHELDGTSAAAGPWEASEDVAWFEEEYFTFHGVEHEWRWGYGWTVPFEGCIVSANDNVCDSAYEIGRDHGPGRYFVDDDWDDTACLLFVIAEVSP